MHRLIAASLLALATAGGGLGGGLATPALAAGPAPNDAGAPLRPSAAWDDIRDSLIGNGSADLPEDASLLLLSVPVRADDPALVPVHVTQPPGAARVEKLAIVVDENPAPVAATFTLGEAMAPLDFEVRVRVNAYSDLRAIAWLEDGRVVQAGHFVKASGGCAAPAGRSAEEAAKTMGQMRLRAVPAASRATGGDARDEAVLMIRHPNNSGLQRDQVTLLDIPAMFIHTLEVKQGDALWFRMDGGISISEDPVFRMAVTPGQGDVAVQARDTDGHVWNVAFPFPPPQS